MTEKLFFEKMSEYHGDAIRVMSYIDLKDASEVICNCEHHGEFSSTVHNLIHHKIGCPYCRLHNSKSPYKTTEQLVYKLKLKYGDRFRYDNVHMGGRSTTLTCPLHGDFEVNTQRALRNNIECPACSYNKRRQHNSSKTRNPKAYTKWNNMLVRCFNARYHEKQPTYASCTICDEWLDFNNFVAWFEDPKNGYRDGYQLDKDLLGGNSKHYSPETCCFVPQTVNAMLTRGAKIRGKVKSIGVTLKGNKYMARCNFGHKEAKVIGIFDNEQEAFEAYRKAKKSYMEQLANSLYAAGEITERVYNGLLNYEIKQYD